MPSTHSEEIRSTAESIANNKKKVAAQVEELASGTRRERQQAAAVIAQVSTIDPEILVEHIPALIDALNRPEAQTRWEVLDALSNLVPLDAKACEKAIVGAETALFDETSGPVRLSAMKFLCKFGATTTGRSDKVWPLIDEGIQCYHGDLEFPDMMLAVIDFSAGKLSANVKKELADRIRFDAENGKGGLKKRATAVMSNLE